MEAILGIVYHGGWAARAWSLVPGALDVETTRYEIALPQATGCESLKICFVSDLHIGPTTPRRLLENAVAALEREKPDVVLFGGDYVFLKVTDSDLRFLGTLVGRVTAEYKYAVMGNHDNWACRDAIERTLEDRGVRVLANRSVRLPEPYDFVAISGLEDPRTANADADRMLGETGDATVRVTVCHSPNGAFDVIGRADLFLAGHTHGGQIALPGGLPVILPKGEGCRRWSRGIYECAGTRIIVSRGIGGTELPMRTFSRPEIVVVTLICAGT